jgi:hypothetical protein
LRAKRSNPCSSKERVDCFVAALLAMTLECESAISPQVSREFCQQRSALCNRRRRECRTLGASAAACAVVVSTRVSHHGHAGNVRHSPRDGVTAYSVLSPATGLFCHRHLWCLLHKLDASVGASGPHVFAVRLKRIRQSAIRVHRIPPRVRDDREPPLMWDETAEISEVIWVGKEWKYFCEKGWTGKSVICPSGKRLAIASQRVGAKRRPMAGSVKQSIARQCRRIE